MGSDLAWVNGKSVVTLIPSGLTSRILTCSELIQVKSSQVAFNEWVWQSHKLIIKIQLINVQTQKNIAQKHIAQKLIAQNTCEKNI